MKWFTADLHFFHAQILEYDKRPFASLEHMHSVMVRNWNATVKGKDTVYILGDVGFGSVTRLATVLNQLNGQLILVRGNHDRKNNLKLRKLIIDGEPVFHDYSDIEHVKIGDQWVCLSHFPYDETRFRELAPQDCGHWLLHGHTHNLNPKIVRGRMINVGCMLWDYKPVSEDTVRDIMQKGELWTR